jgi:hypothetical protein
VKNPIGIIFKENQKRSDKGEKRKEENTEIQRLRPIEGFIRMRGFHMCIEMEFLKKVLQSLLMSSSRSNSVKIRHYQFFRKPNV